MPNNSLFLLRAVEPCPAQGGRLLSRECWDGLHDDCVISMCRCYCHLLEAKAGKPTPPVQEVMDFDSIGSVQPDTSRILILDLGARDRSDER